MRHTKHADRRLSVPDALRINDDMFLQRVKGVDSPRPTGVPQDDGEDDDDLRTGMD